MRWFASKPFIHATLTILEVLPLLHTDLLAVEKELPDQPASNRRVLHHTAPKRPSFESSEDSLYPRRELAVFEHSQAFAER